MEVEPDGSLTLDASGREMMFKPEMLLCSQPPRCEGMLCGHMVIALPL